MTPYSASRAKHSSKQSTVRSRTVSKCISKEKQARPNRKKLARAEISETMWLRSTPLPCFRAPSGCRARPSSDVERNLRKRNAGAVFSRAVEEKEACSSSDFKR